MKVALLSTRREYSLYARCLKRLKDVEWVGSCVQGAGKPPRCEDSEPGVFPSSDMLMEKADVLVAAGAAEAMFDPLSHALRRGKAVWAAWPMAGNLMECRKLAALAEEARVCTRAYRPGLRTPVFQAFRAAHAQTAPVRMACAEIRHRRSEDETLYGFLQEHFFPLLDRVLAVAGSDVKKVSARSVEFGSLPFARIKVDMEFNSGADAVFLMDRVSAERASSLSLMGRDFCADLDFAHPKAVLRRAVGGGTEQWVLPLREMRPIEEDLTDFFSCVAQGYRENLTFADGAKVQGIYEEILRKIAGNE